MRSFSKLKRIKTDLSSTMAQERPGGLAVISINNDVSQNLFFDAVIDDFAFKEIQACSVLKMFRNSENIIFFLHFLVDLFFNF